MVSVLTSRLIEKTSGILRSIVKDAVPDRIKLLPLRTSCCSSVSIALARSCCQRVQFQYCLLRLPLPEQLPSSSVCVDSPVVFECDLAGRDTSPTAGKHRMYTPRSSVEREVRRHASFFVTCDVKLFVESLSAFVFSSSLSLCIATPACNVACTLQWEPVCGTNALTYGNSCMLESDACL